MNWLAFIQRCPYQHIKTLVHLTAAVSLFIKNDSSLLQSLYQEKLIQWKGFHMLFTIVFSMWLRSLTVQYKAWNRNIQAALSKSVIYIYIYFCIYINMYVCDLCTVIYYLKIKGYCLGRCTEMKKVKLLFYLKKNDRRKVWDVSWTTLTDIQSNFPCKCSAFK